MTSIGDQTVLERAMAYAKAQGFSLTIDASSGLNPGTMLIDPIGKSVTVHPDADKVTLDMNTKGPILPGAYDHMK